MKSIKKTAFLLFSLVILTALLTVGVCADELELEYGEGTILNYNTATIDFASIQNYAVNQDALSYALTQLRYSAAEINLYERGYRMSVKEVGSFLLACRYAAPDLFYMEDSYSYSYATVGDNVYLYSIIPQYNLMGKALGLAKSDYNAKINAIVEMAAELDTDLEKALFYHEYIVANYEYDLSYTNYDAYSMLNTKKGVCQAYTLLYIELLNREGIDNTAVLSDGLNHVWNALEIDGKWFLADLTWDDPTYDIPGRVFHNYFLRSMGAFGHLLSNGSRDWVVVDGRTLNYSTAYDGAFWCSYEGWVHPYESKVYYKNFDGSKTYVYNRTLSDLTSENRMFNVASDLYVSGGYYPDALGFCGLGDKLYYAMTKIHGKAFVYEYDLDDGAAKNVYTYSHVCSDANCSVGILSLMPDGEVIRFHEADITNPYNGTVGYFEIYVPMDVDGDRSVTNADITVYVRYLSGWRNVTFVSVSADVDKNGKCNNRDLIAVIRYLNS